MAKQRIPVAAGALILLLLVAPASAQSGGAQSFPAGYFASSNPADAYDMVRKLPGFELIDVDDEVRGFSGSRGNVLFDGRAPAGKQESLEQALKRIPASSVLRIDLIRGGVGGTAAGNYELVANIIRRSASSRSASALAGAAIADRFGVQPKARLELSSQWTGGRMEGAFELDSDVDDESGHGSIVELAADGATETQDRDEREIERTISLDGEYEFGMAGGKAVTNLNLARKRTNEKIETDGTLSTEVERLWSGEAGAQYSAGVGRGVIEALFVQRLGRLRIREEEEDERFTDRTRTSEMIGRVDYRRGGGDFRVYGSVEGAINSLASRTELTDTGDPEENSSSRVEVREHRLEGALGATWKAAPALLVEPSIRAEFSRLRAAGSAKTFVFLKPRLRATWDHGRTRLQATVEREAAQLDFRDFVTSADLNRNDFLAGAISLRPPTTWSASLTFEQRFWDDGSVSLTYRREWINDVIDRVVIDSDGELFDAIGNIGRGDRHILRTELTAPFARIGIPGMQFRAAVTFLHSRVIDPVTGDRRIFADDHPVEGDLSLTHDIPGGRWSWGVDASLGERERDYRLDEVRQERVRTSFGTFVEFRPGSDWRVRAEAENITSRRLIEEREEFDGPRSTGAIQGIETRRIRTAPVFSLTLRKSFGAGAAD